MVLRYIPPKSHTGQEEPPDRGPVNRRLSVARVIIGLVFVIFALRMWQLQVVKGHTYEEQADENRWTIIEVEAARGLIYARNGELLARNAPGYQVSIVPAYLPDDEKEEMAVYRRLGELLDMPASGLVEAAVGDVPQVPAQALATVRSLTVLERLEVLSPLLERRMSLVGEDYEDGIKEIVDRVRGYRDYKPHIIKEGVDRETALLIAEESLWLPGVRVRLVPGREYPTGALTSQVVGYLSGIPEDQAQEYEERDYIVGVDLIGFTGIEKWYEDVLRGKKGSRFVEEDVNGRVLRELDEGEDPVPGDNVELTLDLELQQYATERLQRALYAPQIHSQRGVVIAMDPRNGQILALVSLPTYDNNVFPDGISPDEINVYQRWARDPYKPFLNHAVGDQLPPGSIYKVIPASAALQEGVIDRNTHLVGEGRIVIPNRYFPNDPGRATPFVCWIWLNQGGAHGSLDVVGGLAHSCDIFFYKVGGGFEETKFEGLGEPRLSQYNRLFGLGQLTGIDLPGEAIGLSPPSFREWKRLTYGESWSTGDTYNLSIGQGFLLATPLQMLNATVAVANGGALYRPQLLLKVTDQKGKVVRDFEPEVIRYLPIDLTHLATVREGMESAVVYGTAIDAQLLDPEGNTWIRVAGKTGTAEFHCIDEELQHGLCLRSDPLPTHAWFTAYAPVEAPEIALIVYVYNGGEGSETAVPIAHDILAWYFQRKADITADFIVPAEPAPPDSGQPAP
ncbi:MAG: penicillin-binding protein 2 [Anaerolineae bacterium]